VVDGTYQPMSRPIFIYANNKSLEKPEVKEFVNFYLENASKLVAEVQYVPLPTEAYTAALENVNKRKVGTVFGGKNEIGVTVGDILKRDAAL
jgi:phosphate transport system substrate-binding protein